MVEISCKLGPLHLCDWKVRSLSIQQAQCFWWIDIMVASISSVLKFSKKTPLKKIQLLCFVRIIFIGWNTHQKIQILKLQHFYSLTKSEAYKLKFYFYSVCYGYNSYIEKFLIQICDKLIYNLINKIQSTRKPFFITTILSLWMCMSQLSFKPNLSMIFGKV
jgi:hypothetical protein